MMCTQKVAAIKINVGLLNCLMISFTLSTGRSIFSYTPLNVTCCSENIIRAHCTVSVVE